MNDRLSILSVQAHPDDEASKGAGTIARYSAEGVWTVLVCCTGGESGEVLNWTMDSPETRANIHEIRMEELAQATKIIGYNELIMLGYRDSGMAGWAQNFDVRSFKQANLDEAIGRMVAIFRRVKPNVVITYPPHERQQGYPHPDHLQVHTVTVGAFDKAGDPDAYQWAGAAWQPQKLYYSAGFSQQRMIRIHEELVKRGMESPLAERIEQMRAQPDDTTTRIDIRGFQDVSREALAAHATQMRQPREGQQPPPQMARRFGYGLPPEVMRKIWPYEEFALARSEVKARTPEKDLLAGIRPPKPRAAPAASRKR